MENFILHGDICYSEGPATLVTHEDGWLLCLEGKAAGLFPRVPEEYRSLPVADFAGRLVVPGLVDLHIHAPQYGFRGLGMDLPLLRWLQERAFPEEAKFARREYAENAYRLFVEDLLRGPATRCCVFATVHVEATLRLMEMLEESGLVTYVGKVNMDRNAPAALLEEGTEATRRWLDSCASFKNCRPILTPRFIPACSDGLLEELGRLRREKSLPVQSHLSENRQEVAWVRELCPWSGNYASAYARFGLAGDGDEEGEKAPTVMAHCVWSGEEEAELLRERGVFIAHCPQSNMNLASGIAPARRFLEMGIPLGLGSDVAGGAHASIFRAMADAVGVSKLRACLLDESLPPLTVEEAFYLGSAGGGAFFGRAGTFAPGADFDALVLDDGFNRAAPFALSVRERLERAVYFTENRHIQAKYVRGRRVL